MDTNHLSYPSQSSGASTSTSSGSGSGSDSSSDNGAQHVLIFFVPGNPGLIGYYGPFLSALRDLLDANVSRNAINFHIHGQNLAGFIDQDHEPFTSHRKPYNLEFQIQHIFKTATQ
ncbi:hypothetical protein ONZ43_g6934 [Nemania bipapillata]|uniref:Uncharacterized protein n=1 Tax=Nemania bipapillata TaxID=110536 RepID=A0ACC2HUN5_9PEZI|nr:hypothetical protein ONZ43_g6934 [Nemania bipapillata]